AVGRVPGAGWAAPPRMGERARGRMGEEARIGEREMGAHTSRAVRKRASKVEAASRRFSGNVHQCPSPSIKPQNDLTRGYTETRRSHTPTPILTAEHAVSAERQRV